jgi:hypothetical protein
MAANPGSPALAALGSTSVDAKGEGDTAPAYIATPSGAPGSQQTCPGSLAGEACPPREALLRTCREVFSTHGGPAQYLRKHLQDPETPAATQEFLQWLWETIPLTEDAFCHFSGPLNGSAYSEALKLAPDRVHVAVLGFAEECLWAQSKIWLSCLVACSRSCVLVFSMPTLLLGLPQPGAVSNRRRRPISVSSWQSTWCWTGLSASLSWSAPIHP